MSLTAEYASLLLDWYDHNKRNLPWRDQNDPYLVWISEIMLQQTRVDQALPYFRRFVERFPNLKSLAEAEQDELMLVWEGLGYYSRARNLHTAAKFVNEKLNGQLPQLYDELLALKGIGPYTAAAISSIAFGEKRAVVDGNVIRVITRAFGIEDDVRKSTTQKDVQSIVDQLIDEQRPGDFNQAIMELGSELCKPKQPQCSACPWHLRCEAFRHLKTDVIPYKSPAKKRPHHHICIGIVVDERKQVLITKRPDDAMLGGLWEFPGGKQEEKESLEEATVRELKEELGIGVEIRGHFMSLDHQYSHFKITLHAFICNITSGNPQPKASTDMKWVPISNLRDFAFPKANRTLTEKLISDPPLFI